MLMEMLSEALGESELAEILGVCILIFNFMPHRDQSSSHEICETVTVEQNNSTQHNTNHTEQFYISC